MISATHVLYAKETIRYIQTMYGVTLKKNSLLYGSVWPDFSSRVKKKYPHYLNDSLDMVADKVDFMIETLLTKKELETRKFARDLGGIMHYVGDYFCRTHNDVMKKPHPRKLKHIAYERKLHQFILRCHLEVLQNDLIQSLEYDMKEMDRLSFKDYVVYKHNKYMKEASKRVIMESDRMIKETDVIYSYEMELLVASYMVWKVMGKTKLLGK